VFDDVPGQEKVKEMFARALRERTLSHAYLLSGPEGLAKTAFARELAVALVSACGGCGACPECERARRGIHPDLHVVEREGDLIRFEQVGPVIADLSLKPFAAGRRVWVIPEVEYLHPAAANKLLKSIEEPPDYVYFLLVTDRLERVLPTIVSRCQQVEFRPLSDEQVATYLRERYGLGGAEAAALARLSGGAVERAQRLADDARGPGRRAKFLKQVALLLAGVRGDKAADAQRAFINVLEQQHLEIKGAIQTDLEKRLGGACAAVPGPPRSQVASGPRRRPRQARGDASASPGGSGRGRPARGVAARPLGGRLRGIRCTLELRPRRRARRSGRGDAGLLCSPAGGRCPDSQGPVSEHRPEARAAGHVRAL